MNQPIQTSTQSLDIRLGADLKSPIVGNFQPIKGLDVLLQDVQRLLLTVPGERLFRPTYGCNLRNQVWESIDTAFNKGSAEIRTALKTFEPRITVTAVNGSMNRNTGLINFVIRFTVNSTNTNVNLVFPFRVGTQLSQA